MIQPITRAVIATALVTVLGGGVHAYSGPWATELVVVWLAMAVGPLVAIYIPFKITEQVRGRRSPPPLIADDVEVSEGE